MIRNLIFFLHQNTEDSFKSNRKTDSRNILAQEFTDQVVVASTACDSTAVSLGFHLEDRAGVVALSTDERWGKFDREGMAGDCIDRVHDLLEGSHVLGVTYFGHTVKIQTSTLKQRDKFLYGSIVKGIFF